MKTISYNNKPLIHIGYNLTSQLFELISQLCPSKIFILSDSILEKIHVDSLLNSWISYKPSIPVYKCIVPTGELSKSVEALTYVLDSMFSLNLTRDSLFLALGGGVIGDLGGLASSLYMRGLNLIHIPTTLLAMTDSSIGGKNGIDLIYGKNLIGTFYIPKYIIVDIMYLNTLSDRQISNGFAEIIKTACIYYSISQNKEKKHSLFDFLETYADEILNSINYMHKQNSSTVETVDLSFIDKLMFVVSEAISFKNKIVELDFKESSLRSVLNFGHSIGHAIEAVLAPDILHGECVSVGIMKECEIARSMGLLNQSEISRITNLLSMFNLPTKISDKLITNNLKDTDRVTKLDSLNYNNLIRYLSMDKKNKGNQKKLVMLEGIGYVKLNQAIAINERVLKRVICNGVNIPVFRTNQNNKQKDYFINVPGSKSVSNRALVLAALGRGRCLIKGLLHSDDTKVMLKALTKLGVKNEYIDNGNILSIMGTNGFKELCLDNNNQDNILELYLQNAGTAVRILTAACCLLNTNKEVMITGNDRMKQRPIKPLLEALRQNGCDIKCIEKEGFLPILIMPNTSLRGNEIRLDASISSQYVSAILIAAAYSRNITKLVLDTKAISQPYIAITVKMMQQFGAIVEKENNNVYKISNNGYNNPNTYMVEGDASSATYPLAYAALTGTKCTVTNMGSNSLQGDARFASEVLEKMGCTVTITENETTVQGPSLGNLKGISEIDMESMTDAFLTATVLSSFVQMGKDHETVIYGIANQRVKECNRLLAMRTELTKIGVFIEELEDGLKIKNIVEKSKLKQPKEGINCYDDHRVAMSMSLCSALVDITINDKECVSKTWPSYFDDFEQCFKQELEGVETTDTSVNNKNNIVNVNHFDNKPNVVVFVGMRGVGKSTFGKYIANIYGLDFIDIDDLFSKKLNIEAGRFIEENGWNKFRDQEYQFLNEVITSSNNRNGLVVSCGGGIIESNDSINLLKKAQNDNVVVVHLLGDLETIKNYLTTSQAQRPPYKDSESIESVYYRRQPIYNEVSKYSFYVDFKDGFTSEKYKQNSKKLHDFIEQVVFNKTLNKLGFLTGNRRSYFVCVSTQDANNVIEEIEDIVAGCNALEVRVDSMFEHNKHTNNIDYYVFKVQKTILKLKSRIELPIIYTIRTKKEGGNIDFEQAEFNDDDIVKLIEIGFKTGCEIIDFEINTYSDFVNRKVMEMRNKYNNVKLLTSFHNLNGEFEWKNKETISLIMKMKSFNAEIMKIVANCNNNNLNNTELNSRCIKYQSKYNNLIAINMGDSGKITRIMNRLLTPITHEKLQSSASGQLTIKQINSFLDSLCLFGDRKRFYLLGSPISKSPSPIFHNACFEKLNIPYTYSLLENDDIDKTMDIINRDSNFNGSSVTIPHKCNIIPYLKYVSNDALQIGAVNTILTNITNKQKYLINKQYNNKSTKILYGDNMDWLAVYNLIKSKYVDSNRIKNNLDSKNVLVIGAGGTARACLYALYKLRINSIYLFNRTKQRLEEMCTHFRNLLNIVPLFGDNTQLNNTEFEHRFDIVIDTLPLDAIFLNNKDMCYILKENNGIYVRLAYHSYNHNNESLIKESKKLHNINIITGLDILLEQAKLQFELFTDLNCPFSYAVRKVLKEQDN